MISHIDRAKANEQFLHFIDQGAGDDFVEWKITVNFYTALHYLKAFLIFKKVGKAHSHKDIDLLINPAHSGSKFPLPQDIYNYYNTLYQISWESRYSGVYNTTFQELLLQAKYKESKECLLELKKYFKKEGLRI